MTNLQKLIAAGKYEEALEAAKEQFPTKIRLIDRLAKQLAKYEKYWTDRIIPHYLYVEILSDIISFQLLDLEQE